MRRPLPLALLLLAACATKHEALGDRAFRAGDVPTAAAEYDEAMRDTPMMDFEYERIRKKRMKMMAGAFAPRVDALIARAPTPPTADYVTELLTLRREAFAAGIPPELAKVLDTELLRVSNPAALATTNQAEVPTRLGVLVTLFDTAMEQGAPQQTVDAVTSAYGATLATGWPAIPADGGLQRLEALLVAREAARTRRFPAAADAAYDTELARLADATFPAATREQGFARFQETARLRKQARALAAPAPALAFADRAHQDALGQVLAHVDAEAAAHRYVPLFDAVLPLTEHLEPGHPLLARLDAVAKEGAAWHTSQATSLPPGYRALLHRSMAATLGGDRAAADAARKALEPKHATALTLQVKLSESGSCGGFGKPIPPTLGQGTRTMPVDVALASCHANEGDTFYERDHRYIAEEIYYVQENVQVGTRRERQQTGTQQVQCTKDSSLEGYAWVGLCDQPVYSDVDVPIYELRDVEKRRDVERYVRYTVTKRSVDVGMSGTAALVWDDGTTLRVPFSPRRTEAAEGWSYDVPGRTEADPSTHHEQRISPYLRASQFHADMGTAIGGTVATDMAAQVRAHRAGLARAEGARALANADAAGAGEAFVRSVLHDGKAEGEALAWLTKETSLSREALEGVLVGGAARAVPAGAALPAAAAYAPAAITVGAGAAMRVDEAVTEVSTESYQKGIMPPNEFVDFHVGLVPMEIQTGPDIGSRVAPVSFGIDMHYNPIEIAAGKKMRYGLVVHDQLGLRFTLGMTYVEKVEYRDGDEEGPIALTVDPTYALYLGLRTPYVGLFAGASGGYLHAASGDTLAYGWHVEPGARLTLRAFGTKNLILEASGFVGVPGVARKDRVMLSIPVLGRNSGIDLKLSVERTMLPARKFGPDGETEVSLGTLPVQMVGVQVGARM